ncbi:MAG TPA: T9SS type A sorting domain-containing protein, partial [Ignavibacteriaceae bacterium]
NITSTATLVPGSYGNVTLGTSKTLNLSTGDYYFNSISMGGSGKLKLNVANGNIRIYVTGNVTFGTSVEIIILNGGPEKVYLETLGNFQMGGSGKWNGSLFCPLGNITLGTSCTVYGALWTNGEISVGGSTKIYYRNNTLAKGSDSPENNEEETILIPNEISLEQNYPNPFNPTTTINYQLPEKNHVSLKVYDILGNLVSTLVDQDMEAGYYSVNWDASQLASGIYIYRISSSSFVSTKKMILMK